ncbi:MAG: abortive infection system antitoxin AbiGi family protein, partial [Pyrinomonadaceae bacterium]
MTEEQEIKLSCGGETLLIPATPKVCFTELKLSESRKHARQYGRLGIGVKRPFLFRRSGRPLLYYGFHEWTKNDKFLEACAKELQNKDLLNFFKPMNSSETLNYDLYGESEWRIIYFKELLEKKLIKDPRDTKNSKEHEY